MRGLRRERVCGAVSYGINSGVGWETEDQRTNTAGNATEYSLSQDDLLGGTLSIRYPSGRTIDYTQNAADRPVSAVDASTSVDYANAIHYAANGAPCWEDYGSAITSAETFNSRQQPLNIQANAGVITYQSGCPGLGQTGNLIDLQYCFTNWESGVCQTSTTDNSNVNGITNNIDGTRSQGFFYDALNRIITGETTSTYSTSPSHCWGESFFYDNNSTVGGAWGNLTSIGVANTSYNGCTQDSLSQSVTADNQISSFCYDAAGNLLGESACPASTYAYNAENQLKSTVGVNYTYDGDGKRIEKSSGTLYWYGPDGNVLDETDLSGNVTNEYVYLGSRRIARVDTSGNVFYYLSDSLGTSRVTAEVPYGSTTATLCYNADFTPFGGERPYVDTCDSHYKFTGKERDSESNLDNFGARYFTSSMGRFISPDWSSFPEPIPYAKLSSPQSLNLYSYTVNNPLTLTDPTGHDDCEGTAYFCFSVNFAAFQLREAASDIDNPGMFALQGVSAALGTAGDNDGIIITSGDLGPATSAGFVGAKTTPNGLGPNGGGSTITFNSNSALTHNIAFAPDFYAITLAHEGTHAEDNAQSAALASAIKLHFTSRFEGLVDNLTSSKKFSRGEFLRDEIHAYTNQGYMEEFLHMNGQIYDPSVPTAQQAAHFQQNVLNSANEDANNECHQQGGC